MQQASCRSKTGSSGPPSSNRSAVSVSHRQFRGSFPIPIIIHKDGSVKARNADATVWNRDLKDALVEAINKWKYKPYLVDGQPVEVAWTVIYILDGKPFVPSYERAQQQAVPSQQDSAPDGTNVPARRRWH